MAEDKELQGQLVQRAPAAVSSKAASLSAAFDGLVPKSIGEAQVLSGALAGSSCIPKALRGKADNVLAVMLTGLEIGLSPMQAVNNITIISGNLSMKANLQLAIVRQSGQLAFWEEGWDQTAQDEKDHFGWCRMARAGVLDEHGKPKVYERRFSVADARKVITNSRDEEEGEGGGRYSQEPKTPKPLAEKSNYKNWPERMYPLRARTWLMDSLFGDLLRGLPATEALEGGQVGEVVTGEVVGEAPDYEARLATIRDESPELATGIESAFEVLKLAPARRLQKLVEFEGRAGDLLHWLKQEYAGRTFKKGYREKGPELKPEEFKAAAAAETKAEPAPAATEPRDAEIVAEPEPTVDPKPEPVTAAPTATAPKARKASRLDAAKDWQP